MDRWVRPCTGRMLAPGLVLLAGLASAAPRDSGSSLNLLLKAPLDDDGFVISRSNLATRDHHGKVFWISPVPRSATS